MVFVGLLRLRKLLAMFALAHEVEFLSLLKLSNDLFQCLMLDLDNLIRLANERLFG